MTIKTFSPILSLAACALAAMVPLPVLAAEAAARAAITKDLTFYASFDHGVDADFALGDARLFTVVATKPERKTEPGLHTAGATRLASGKGRRGNALEFTKREASWIFFDGFRNVDYRARDWSGTVSLWLKLDPETDLDPGFADPLQLTTRAWNDGSFFVDFNKDGDPRDFRLGAFSDLSFWNPGNKEIPENQWPMLKVLSPPFGSDEWTHVVFTWRNFNIPGEEAVATLYMNGKKRGTIGGRTQTYTRKPEEQIFLYLGLNYIGLMDEVACFGRALSDDEVMELHGLKGSVLTGL